MESRLVDNAATTRGVGRSEGIQIALRVKQIILIKTNLLVKVLFETFQFPGWGKFRVDLFSRF